MTKGAGDWVVAGEDGHRHYGTSLCFTYLEIFIQLWNQGNKSSNTGDLASSLKEIRDGWCDLLHVAAVRV